jgi:hypothetical protein
LLKQLVRSQKHSPCEVPPHAGGKGTLANGAVASALQLWHPPHKSCGTPSRELRATIGGAPSASADLA